MRFLTCKSPEELHNKLQCYAHPEEDYTVRTSHPANWITQQGVWKIQRDLEPRMPDIKRARFITLTLDPEKFDYDPEEGYEKGKRHLREFLYQLDKYLGRPQRTPYCWKLEFTRSGWPHWHIIFLYKKSIPAQVLNTLWGRGRTNIEMIRDESFSYLFKYVSKTADDIPPFIMKRKQVRFFQSSKGFLASKDRKYKKDHDQGERSRRESTLDQRIDRWCRTVKFKNAQVTIVYEADHLTFYADLSLFTAQQMMRDHENKNKPRAEWAFTHLTLEKRTLCQQIRKLPEYKQELPF